MKKTKTIEINQWDKARELIREIYENKVEQERRTCDRLLVTTKFIEKEDPNCIIEFIEDADGNNYNVRFNYDENLQSYIDTILETGVFPTEVIRPAEKLKLKFDDAEK
jgi:hypothetical protein